MRDFNGNACGPGYSLQVRPRSCQHTSVRQLADSIPIAFPSAAATHIVQAAHANAKTKTYPKSVAASAYGGLRQTVQPGDE
ncbi:MAG: hypothetical protein IM606_15725 [Cytophagales bacterium]|jgi:hypothetical protein|nr:hypothetical protein [Cytophagales bacterium]MCA6392559.1 hypothetical protein [Cytophagales bacterium]MCA6396632.1 hypothetical protein [Cytophagales bacterium]MCA6401669.1 hypothetical protein [Cytophagales bacterium]MCA6410233.1 hypothetical protein [Cytophagales bacterium]